MGIHFLQEKKVKLDLSIFRDSISLCIVFQNNKKSDGTLGGKFISATFMSLTPCDYHEKSLQAFCHQLWYMDSYKWQRSISSSASGVILLATVSASGLRVIYLFSPKHAFSESNMRVGKQAVTTKWLNLNMIMDFAYNFCTVSVLLGSNSSNFPILANYFILLSKTKK